MKSADDVPGGDPRAGLLALRATVIAELVITRAALADIRKLRSDRSDDDEHDPEGTPLSAEWSRLTGLNTVAERRVADVEAAISRLDDGRYGTCDRCGQPIPVGRLEVLPTATRCVRCASLRR